MCMMYVCDCELCILGGSRQMTVRVRAGFTCYRRKKEKEKAFYVISFFFFLSIKVTTDPIRVVSGVSNILKYKYKII
jgi:hypothetical protein